MNKSIIALATLAASVACFDCFAKSCSKCSGSGFARTMIKCECCNGEGTVLPERLGKAAGVTRWTETTYWTGAVVTSNFRKKKYSENPCPVCKSSSKRGYERENLPCETCGGTGCVGDLSALDVTRMAAVLKSQISALEKVTKTVKAADKKYNHHSKEALDQLAQQIESRKGAIARFASNASKDGEDCDSLLAEMKTFSEELKSQLKFQRSVDMLMKHNIAPYEAWKDSEKDSDENEYS